MIYLWTQVFVITFFFSISYVLGFRFTDPWSVSLFLSNLLVLSVIAMLFNTFVVFLSSIGETFR